MSLLAAAVVFSTALGLLNLLLAYGIIRRLRAGNRDAPPAFPVTDAESVGTVLEDFTARLPDGRDITARTIPDGALAAFFAPGCGPCAELLPRFVETVGRSGRSAAEVLAVVVPGRGDAEEQEREYASLLSPVATVVTGEGARAVEAAFGVNAYPVVCRVESGGRLTALARDLHELVPPVTV
ncbi:hypothetical protein GCM10010503_15610 [Streptomyces lucensis JCM 4490]|uniref:Thioredoxin domain-containing protein n=1 Tax=Streptomyces lucensis JCM 4490 TaxID=1306176 RepID=A0A918J1Q7_9ACTN|nr:hypothetical protein [Streptomyces lucensis]GGW40055.1 hypothetical protein GCM10010503_15610 [Streptomyces lucensis JCM 4490]